MFLSHIGYPGFVKQQRNPAEEEVILLKDPGVHQGMKNTRALLCVSLVLCGVLTECFAFTLVPKDKRGWTLNSAGYLLGPHAHRTLTDKGGKREALDDLHKTGLDLYNNQVHSVDEDSLQTILEFLSFLRLKEQGALDHLSLPISSEESSQP